MGGGFGVVLLPTHLRLRSEEMNPEMDLGDLDCGMRFGGGNMEGVDC